VYGGGFTQHPDLSVMGVFSALEMACWDIIGKAAGQPVYKLLGGQVHERLRSYTYIYPRADQGSEIYHDAELSAERAHDYLRQGFTALKFDPVGPYSVFAASCRSRRWIAPSGSCGCCARRSAPEPICYLVPMDR
jgi:2-dehydro-3-deoxyphosphogalactonate aldolase